MSIQDVADNLSEKKCKKCGLNYGGKYCKPCRNIREKAWREANPEKVRAASQRYSEANREAIRLKAESWRKANPDRWKEANRRWKLANPEKQKAYLQSHLEANRESIYKRHREWNKANRWYTRLLVQNRRARMRKNGGVLSKNIAEKLLTLQKGLCACCRVSLDQTGHHLDHVMPVAKGGRNEDSNIQLLCPSCNHAKQAQHPIDFMRSRGFLL